MGFRFRFCFALLAGFLISTGCGSSSSTRADGTGAAGGGGSDDDGGGIVVDDAAGGVQFDVGGFGEGGAITISPADTTVTVEPGQPPSTVQFSVQVGGSAATAKWQVDNPDIGDVDSTGLFTPSGIVGGVVKVTATVGGVSGTATVTVIVHTTQNGAAAGELDAGAADASGGFGGVGGEGLGDAVDDGLRAILRGAATPSSTLNMLYPYDKTVWPLGILAPLLQWTDTPSPADGISIHLSGDYFDYTGFFTRPSALAAGTPFVRHPIPEDVWSAATRSAAGRSMTIEVVVAAGGTAYGPMKATWTMSKTQVQGTVYYQSYGTKLVENEKGAQNTPGGRFGGATLAIRVDSTNPVLVAGTTTPDKSGCRVCHSVSALGNKMVVQHGDDYSASSAYDLNQGYLETPYPGGTNGLLGWVGMSPDGKIGLGNSRAIAGAESTGGASLYDLSNGSAMPSQGLTDFATKVGLPAFSPDGKRVAFTFLEGPGTAASGTGADTKLASMDFDQASSTFSNPILLADNAGGGPPGFATFLPGGEGVIFETQIGGGPWFQSRYGGKGELWWVDFATKQPTRLDRANGKDQGVIYIPTGPNNHDDDTVLNYDPSVAPTISGGYAWLIFQSRRLYGNTATIDPWWSDPRDHDLTQTPTTKKLWAVAIDLNPQPGTDPSHPPFYVPGQEILAGNARPFWVLNPCTVDGVPCGLTGPRCSVLGDKCQVSDDCCNGTGLVCIAQKCAHNVPR